MTDLLKMTDLLRRRADRRTVFRSVASMAALGGAAFVTRDAIAQVSPTPTPTPIAYKDPEILNFALNLEYLEANFYSFAVNGAAIPAASASGIGTPGAATGGRQVGFSDPLVAQYAREIARDELEHVNVLRAALGTAAVAQPAIDLGTSPAGAFSSAAVAAGLVDPGQSFDPYASDENFLLAAFLFEDVGVTAYNGASSLLSSKTYLEAAAGIMAVEAYHASIVRATLYRKGINASQLLSSVQRIAEARRGLDVTGSSISDQGVAPTPGPLGITSNIAPLDSDGLPASRAPGQVLNIVYLRPSKAAAGGFFPAGVNGTIQNSAAPVVTPSPS